MKERSCGPYSSKVVTSRFARYSGIAVEKFTDPCDWDYLLGRNELSFKTFTTSGRFYGRLEVEMQRRRPRPCSCLPRSSECLFSHTFEIACEHFLSLLLLLPSFMRGRFGSSLCLCLCLCLCVCVSVSVCPCVRVSVCLDVDLWLQRRALHTVPVTSWFRFWSHCGDQFSLVCSHRLLVECWVWGPLVGLK